MKYSQVKNTMHSEDNDGTIQIMKYIKFSKTYQESGKYRMEIIHQKGSHPRLDKLLRNNPTFQFMDWYGPYQYPCHIAENGNSVMEFILDNQIALGEWGDDYIPDDKENILLLSSDDESIYHLISLRSDRKIQPDAIVDLIRNEFHDVMLEFFEKKSFIPIELQQIAVQSEARTLNDKEGFFQGYFKVKPMLKDGLCVLELIDSEGAYSPFFELDCQITMRIDQSSGYDHQIEIVGSRSLTFDVAKGFGMNQHARTNDYVVMARYNLLENTYEFFVTRDKVDDPEQLFHQFTAGDLAAEIGMILGLRGNNPHEEWGSQVRKFESICRRVA